MEEDKSVIAVQIVVAGMTEEDIFHTRQVLEKMLPIFKLREGDENLLYWISAEYGDDLPFLCLKIDEGYWKIFAETHDVSEFSVFVAQPSIWGETH